MLMQTGWRLCVLVLVGVVLGVPPILADVLGHRDIGRDYPPQNLGWCPFLEAPQQGYSSLRFTATGPAATLTFIVPNESDKPNQQWLSHRIDNVVVVKADAFSLREDVAACTNVSNENICCNLDDSDVYGSRFFDRSIVATEKIVFEDDFEVGADPRWQGVGMTGSPIYWMNMSGAPRPPFSAASSSGALGLGREGDGDVMIETRLNLTNLVAGREYVVAGWWYANEESTISLTAESPPAMEPVGGVERVNYPELAGDQIFPAIAANILGDAVVVWETPSSGCQVIRGRQLSPDGTASGSIFSISDPGSCDGEPNARKPRVDLSTSGSRYAVAWHEEPLAFTTWRTMMRRFDLGLGALGGPVTVKDASAVGALGVLSTRVAWDPQDDRFVVGWYESISSIGGSGIIPFLARVYGGDGQVLSDEAGLAGDGENDGDLVWSNGGLAAAWRRGDLLQGEPFDVVSGRFDALGLPITTPQAIAGLEDPQEIAIAEASGALLVVWSATDSAGGLGIFGRLLDDQGNPLTVVTPISDSAGPSATPDVASDGQRFVVVWRDGGDPGRVRARLIAEDGVPDGASFLVDPDGSISQDYPAVAGGPEGSFQVVWQGTLVGVDEPPTLDILTRRLEVIDALPLDGEIGGLGNATPEDFHYFRVAVPPGLTSLTIRTDGGFGNADLYVRKQQPPTTQDFEFSSTTSGNEEVITLATPQPEIWHVGLRTTKPYDGLRLVASQEPLLHIPIFANGFEGGSTSAWSATAP